MKKYEVDLSEPLKTSQKFEQEDKDFIKIEIKLPNGDLVSDENYSVYVNLSKDAMMALGSALIRSALAGKKHMWEVFPANSEGASRDLGVFMHPKSCSLKVFEEDKGTLADAIKAAGIQNKCV